MIIALATRDDMSEILRMGERFAQASPHASLGFDPKATASAVLNLIEGGAGIVLLGIIDGRVVGMLGALIYPLFFQPAAPIAQELFWWVDPEHRRRGSSALLKAAEDWATSKGAKRFLMLALDALDGERVSAMYSKLGYSPAERTFMKVLQ